MLAAPPPDPHPSLAHLVTAKTRLKWSQAFAPRDQDWVAREEPLEIRVNGYPLSVVMRTPGHDEELVRGFIVSEGIARPDDILRVKHCATDESENVMLVTLHVRASFNLERFSRQLFVSSSCGVCGKRSTEQALATAGPLEKRPVPQPTALLAALSQLRHHQPGYQSCGGLHAAALVSEQGELCVVREDIGRHNAVDKVIGFAVATQQLALSHALLVSGRASFEIVQKALAARLGTIVAVGGVSSLAVELAERAHINLFGFATEHQLNLYSEARHE